MEYKFDKYSARPEAELLSTSELFQLSHSSTELYKVFQPLLKERKLLHFVLRGNQEEVRVLLAQNPDLLTKKTRASDVLGRSFHITPRDYILWALEKDQFETMLSCFPQTKGDQVAEKLRAQYNKPAHQLLLHVVRDNQFDVGDLLKKDIHLLCEKSSVIDLYGRVFNGISPFEYVLWALNERMWNTMLECVQENKQRNKVLEQLKVQYDLLPKGLTYSLNGTLITEPHLYPRTIIKSLQTQVDLLSAQGDNDLDGAVAALALVEETYKVKLEIFKNLGALFELVPDSQPVDEPTTYSINANN